MSGFYDREEFFEGYKQIRANPYSGNVVVEIPTFFEMLPDVTGKRILDLGCGTGENCKTFSQMGASEVIGIDISTKMLDIARAENSCENITYLNQSMEDFCKVFESLGNFDMITSSLAMHYVENYQSLISNLYEILNYRGTLLFSQEHPIFTASLTTAQWLTEGDGKVLGLVVNGYPQTGKRCVSWIVSDFVKYHRTVADILNPIIQCGFQIEEIREPGISQNVVENDISLSRCLQVPDYLFVKAIKPISPSH